MRRSASNRRHRFGTSRPPPRPPLPDRTDAAFGRRNEFRSEGASALTGPTGVEAPSPGAKALLGQ
jgi:hypothetical protein